MNQKKLKKIIRETIESDPEIKKLLKGMSESLESIDVSIDFVAAALTGQTAREIDIGQQRTGRLGVQIPREVPAGRRAERAHNEGVKLNSTLIKKIIGEEFRKIREERGFNGLVVTAVGPGDQEVVRMSWKSEPEIDVLAKTLISTYMMGAVEYLQAEEGEDWLMSNIGRIERKEDRDVAREAFGMDRFSPEEREQDDRLENPGLYNYEEEG